MGMAMSKGNCKKLYEELSEKSKEIDDLFKDLKKEFDSFDVEFKSFQIEFARHENRPAERKQIYAKLIDRSAKFGALFNDIQGPASYMESMLKIFKQALGTIAPGIREKGSNAEKLSLNEQQAFVDLALPTVETMQVKLRRYREIVAQGLEFSKEHSS